MSREKIKTFRDLEIWQKGMAVVKQVYTLSAYLPVEEKYGLISQMRRCAVSLPSNIAEGFRRRNGGEFKQFLHIALGSSAELETQLELCKTLFSVDEKDVSTLLDEVDQFQAMTMGLIKEIW